MRDSQLSKQLTVFVASFIALFALFVGLSGYTLQQVRVMEPIYQQIDLGNDLIADVLPPPQYIIESYLLSLQLKDEADPARRQSLIERGNALRVEYDCDDIELHSEHDGAKALACARALQPVLVLSAAEEPVTKAEVFARGGNDYVVKLPSALELAARIRYHVTAFRAQRDREAAFIALLESRRVLEERNREIETRTQQLEQLNRELAESVVTDALTGLHNRRFLRTFLERPTAESTASRSPGIERRHPLGDGMTLFLLDLDHFKHINDVYGHDAGDSVLIEIARRLRQFIRTGDAVLRWGGEEFLLVARDVCSETAANLAARLLDVIGGKRIRLGHGKSVAVTASIGFAPLPFPAPHGAHGVMPLAGAALLDPINEPITSPEFRSGEDGRRVQLVKILPATKSGN